MSRRRFHTSFNVSTNHWLLQRYGYVEERVFTLLAGWIWSTPSLEQKNELARLSFEDALHADGLRRRAAELLPPTEEPTRKPVLELLDAFCNEIANTDDLGERLVGVFRVVKPRLLEALRQHLDATDEVTDAPTAILLADIIRQEESHIAWGEGELRQLAATSGQSARLATWESHLNEMWTAIGGFGGSEQAAVTAWRNAAPPARNLSQLPARDGRFRIIPLEEYFVSSMGETSNEIIRHLLYINAYGEMEALDMLGRILADAPELPWPMRLDLARQLWDEARHTEMSWRRMEELGGVPDPIPPIPYYILAPVAGLEDPLERLLVLQRVIEGRAAERHRYRVTYIARDLGDPMTARLFEYIVADERAHVGYSDWIHKLVGDDAARQERLEQVHRQAERIFESILNRRADVTAGMQQARR